MSYEEIEQRRARLGPARNTAEQLCYESIEDAIMDVIAAAPSQDAMQIASATARADAYLNAIGIYRRCAGKGHPFSSGAQQPSTPALIAAIRTAIQAIRTNPAGAESVLINALVKATGQISADDDDAPRRQITQLEQLHAALFDAELWERDIDVYAELLALRARYQKGY